MPQILLNGTALPVQDLPENWGELLERLTREAAGRGEVVSAVRFDGVDEPSFHQPARAGLTVHALQSIEVETVAPARLIADALEEGATAAARLADATRETIAAFRTSNLGAANTQLAALGEGTRSLLAVLSLGADAVGASLEGTDWNGRSAIARLNELAGGFATIIEAQEARDWLTVADVLEYDLQPALESAAPVFNALRAALPA